MLSLFYSDGTEVPRSGDAWQIRFPEPTRVGKTQMLQLALKNVSRNDRYQIAAISASDPDLHVEYEHDFLVELKAGYQLPLSLIFSPAVSRKKPLEAAEFTVEAWHVMVTET